MYKRQAEAIDFIAVDTDVAKSTVSVNVHVRVDNVDATAASATVRELREKADRYEREASEHTRRLASDLADKGIPYRDIGAILGISQQRAHQLVEASHKQHAASA